MAAPLHEAEIKARELARSLHDLMPEGWGFVLVLAEIGEGQGCTYIADVNREDAVKLMRETASIIQKQQEEKGTMGVEVN